MQSDELRSRFIGQRFLIIPGHYDYFGGAERQSLLLARGLIEDYDCKVDFLGWGGDGILADKVRELGIAPRVFPHRRESRRLRQLFSLAALARYIRSEVRPDYLLPFVSYHSKVIGSIWKYTGARFCWWNQRDEGRLVQGTPTERRLMRTLPSIVSNSYEGRDFLMRKFGLPEQRIRIINNGVALPVIHHSDIWRRELALEPDELLILMVANLTFYKDHATLLKAFALLVEGGIGKHCRLVLAGRHDEASKDLKALAFDLGLGGRVLMPGVVNPVEDLLASADLVVHSSMKEGCPNAVLEAMAQRKCVVGTDISGMRQALGATMSERFLAPPRDAEALAGKMRLALESRERREEAGKANRLRIEQEFSIPRMTRQVLQTVLDHRVAA